VTQEPHETVWTVLHDAAKGDPSARAAFAEFYARPIRSYLRQRWGGSVLGVELEDALQDAFVECYKPGGVLERADPEQGDFRALLYGVVRNVARRYEERAAKLGHRRPEESVYLDELPDQAASLSRFFDRAWASSLLHEALRRHEASVGVGDEEAARRFAILRLRHDRGMAVREIAAELGEPEVAVVHQDYRRARREFAAHLRAVVAANTGARGSDIDEQCRRLTELLGS
jgi:RNA polymerase sigma factor (sigma-70 family)